MFGHFSARMLHRLRSMYFQEEIVTDDNVQRGEEVARLLIAAKGSSAVLMEATMHVMGMSAPAMPAPRSPAELGLEGFSQAQAAMVMETERLCMELELEGQPSFSTSETLAMAAFESLPDGHELKQKVRDYLPPAFSQ